MMKKRLLSLVLALVMIVSTLNGMSIPVFADEPTVTESEAQQASTVEDIIVCNGNADIYEHELDYESKICTVYVPDCVNSLKMQVMVKDEFASASATMSCIAAKDGSAVTGQAITVVTEETNSYTTISSAKAPITYGYGTGEMSLVVGSENWTVKLLRSARLASGAASLALKDGEANKTISLQQTHQNYVYENSNKTALTANSVLMTFKTYGNENSGIEHMVTVNGQETTFSKVDTSNTYTTYTLDTTADVTTANIVVSAKNDPAVRPTTYKITFYKSHVITGVSLDNDTINLQGENATCTVGANAVNTAGTGISTTDYQWVIEDSSIATLTVDEQDPSKAVLTAVGDGLTRFTVTSAGKTAEGIVLAEVNKKVDVLGGFSVKAGTSASAASYDYTIDSEKKTITIVVPISGGTTYLYPTAATGKILSAAKVEWTALSNNSAKSATLHTKGYLQINGTYAPYLKNSTEPGGTVKMTLTPAMGADEVWTINFVRESCISGLDVAAGDGSTVVLSEAFNVDKRNYSTSVSTAVKTLTFTFTPDYEVSSTIKVNGETVPYDAESGTATYVLNVKEGLNKVVFSAQAEATDTTSATVPREYTLDVTGVAPTKVTFATVPENAIINLLDKNNVHQDSNNKEFAVIAGTYSYTVTAPGYKAASGTLKVTGAEPITKKVELEQAPAGDPLKQLESEWPQYNRNEDNNAVTSAATPITKDAVAVKWQNKIGQEVSNTSNGQSIIVNDRIYMASGSLLMVADKDTGDLIMSQKMSAAVGYQYMPPVYGNGMIFVGQSGGVEAFNAETLKPMWKYSDSTGSMRAQMRYDNGYLYVGFFGSEDGVANWVCLDVTDEDPGKTNEAKVAAWTLPHPGGFYWAGSWSNDKYLFLTGDNEGDSYASIPGSLYCIEKATGNVVQRLDVDGAVRGGIAYYEGRIYFTTCTGYVYSFNITDNGQGIIDTANMIEPILVGGRSTNTPAVYNYRLYFSSAAGSVGNQPDAGIHVIDIDPTTGKMTFAYNVPSAGNCQSSAVISTAYEEDTGYVYVYMAANNSTGSIYIVKDKKGMTEAAPESGLLWSPSPAQYCIHRLVVDEHGTLYYVNDSSMMYALETTYLGLTGITATGGNAIVDEGNAFDSKVSEHTIVTDAGTEKVTLTFATEQGAEVWIDDKTVEGTYEAVLTDGTATVKAVVVNGKNSRVYTMNLRAKSGDADLHSLMVTENEVYSENENLIPTLSKDVTEYENKYLSTCESVYVWPVVADTASIEVTAGTGVESVTASDDGSYYVIAMTEDAESSVVKLNVTAEDTKVTKEYTLTLKPYDILVDSITLSAEEFTLKGEATKTLTATLNPTNATNTDEIKWTSSDESVAKVVADESDPTKAVVTGVANGTAVITVTVGEVSAAATVHVDMVPLEAAITFSNRTKTTVDVHVDTSELGAVFAIVLPADEDAPTAIPLQNPMAIIDDSNLETGVNVFVTTPTDRDNKLYYVTQDKAGNRSGIIELAIPDYVALTGIEIDKTEVSLTKTANTADVIISFAPENTSEAPAITWESSDDSVATVAADESDAKKAVITAVGDGTATITVTAGNFTKTVTVTSDITPVALTEEKVTIANRTDEAADMTIKVKEACTITYVVGGEAPVSAEDILNNEAAKTVIISAEDNEAGKTEVLTDLTKDAVTVYMVSMDAAGNVSDIVTILVAGTFALGDVDCDGDVDVFDAAVILNMINDPELADPEKADLDGDGDIDVFDAAEVLNIINSAE